MFMLIRLFLCKVVENESSETSEYNAQHYFTETKFCYVFYKYNLVCFHNSLFNKVIS